MHYTSPEVYEFISKQTNDPIVERKTCAVSGTKFPITQKDLDFYDKISPSFGGKKYQIPTPTLCPEERQRLRYAFRNERKLYKRNCDATNKLIISNINPTSDLIVYERTYRWSDKRDPMMYGIQYSVIRESSVLSTLQSLYKKVPIYSIQHNKPCENSDYCNIVASTNNCYLVFAASESDHVLYANWVGNSSNCVDCSYIMECRECYECVDCRNVYASIKCIDCKDCSFCIGCDGLTGANYYVNNKEVGKVAYEKEYAKYLAEANITSSSDMSGKLQKCNRVAHSFDLSNLDTGKYCTDGRDSSEVYDYYEFFDDCSYCYLGEENGAVKRSIATKSCYGCFSMMYCINCYSSSNCFGCVGIRSKQYCIFNTQYTKEEYEKIVPILIKKMQEEGSRGEFFEPSMSPFGYNETLAQQYFPLTQQQAEYMSYNWYKEETSSPSSSNVHSVPNTELSKNIDEVSDDIVNKIIVCEETSKPFRILKQELQFYRKHGICLPKLHPDVRHENRMQRRSRSTL